MKLSRATVFKLCATILSVLLAIAVAAPYISAAPVGARLRASLERALGRRVEIRGPVHFRVFPSPGLSASNVVIEEDPAIGFEPIAYVDLMIVRPSLWTVFSRRLAIASVRLDDATINLTKTGTASEPGRWNFASFVNRTVMSTAPAIHVRNGRINFKFGETKSTFYMMNTDFDLSPPGSLGGGWTIRCAAEAARTDRVPLGLGAFTVNGKWFIAPERVDLDVRLERTHLEDFAMLVSGQAGGVHGVISSRLHLAGAIGGIGILGQLTIQDVHRWDLLPPKGEGWPLDLRGRLDLTGQQLELQATSAVVPLTTRFRASEYLSRPRWAVTMTWKEFPVAPLMQLARDMGTPIPAKLQMNGSIDGVIGYSGQSGLQGQLVFHHTAVTIPDSPAVAFDEVRLLLGAGKLWLPPAVVRTAEQDEARLEANYSTGDGTLDLYISTEAMKVESLRAQVALSAVPWLEQANSGRWSGQLHYHREAAAAGWSGNLELADAQVAVPGLADQVEVTSARVGVDGDRVAVDRIVGRAGKTEFTGSYRYQPDTAHPHRLRVRAPRVNAADLEAELMPTLRRNTGLLARALGRNPVPDWMQQRKLEGFLQIGDLEVADSHLRNVRARLLWDVDRVDLLALEATLDRASIEGVLAVRLAGPRPTYKLTANLRGLTGPSGILDAEGTLETSGTGAQLLSRLRLTDLSLRTEDETYTGSGGIQEDGRLLLLFTSGSKEMRMTGSLASLKLDTEARP